MTNPLIKSIPICIILVLILITFTCNDEIGTRSESNIIKEVVTHDTTIVTITITDTLTVPYKVVESIRDTIYRSVDFPINEYHYTIDDSLIAGTIVVEAPFNPVLKYSLTSKTFNTTTKVEKTERNLRGFLYGGQVSVVPLISNIEANIAYQNKRGDIIKLGLGYDFTHNNKLITVGLLKRF
jgi:hypothetical protein